MAITGAPKFFDLSKCLYADGSTITVTSGTASANYMLNMSLETKWESILSTDAVTEEITITLPRARTIDRILLSGINLKEFTIQYGSGHADFTNVIGLDGSLAGGISETDFSDIAAYYEFDAVKTNELYITATKTQEVNQEKYIKMCIATEEIGTVSAPWILQSTDIKMDRNHILQKMVSGKQKIIKRPSVVQIKASFPYIDNQEDIDLFESLWDRDQDFLVWMCGGWRGAQKFFATQEGWKLTDILKVQWDSDLAPNWFKGNRYMQGVKGAMTLRGVV